MAQLLSSLPVGSLVKDTGTTYYGETIIWQVLEHGHTGDPIGSTTLLTKNIITLKCFDAKEPNNSYNNSKQYGNTRYKLSNLFQWLNKDAAAGAWYEAQHAADEPPTTENVEEGYNEYDQEKGFLADFSAYMKAALQTVSKVTVKPNIDGGGTETVLGRVHLLSNTEVGFASDSGTDEGSLYSYFIAGSSGDAGRVAYPTQPAVTNSEYTSSNLATNKGWFWWLRTYNRSNLLDAVRCVMSNGANLTNSPPYSGNRGVRPSICIPSGTEVSDTADADGAYTIIWNASPQISPATTNYGSVSAPPAITCTVTDSDGDSFSGTVSLNGVQKTTFSGTASKTFALDMQTYWGLMSLGTNTITVTATDSKGGSTTVTYTLTKTNSSAPVPTTDLVNNARKEASFYVGFQIGQDADGDSQTVVCQVSASSDMSNPTEFTAVEKQVAGAWLPVQTLTNADAGAPLRIQVTGQTVGNTIYVRLKDSDSGSGAPVYTSVYAIKIGNVLEFNTLPIQKDEMPKYVTTILDKTMPSDATVALYACNNAYDSVPTWEPITENEKHEFTNRDKTAADWGVMVKVTITAGSTSGEISVSAIGLGVL